jgi:Ser/Thr protein kinase RdoA (MazF antagonist)
MGEMFEYLDIAMGQQAATKVPRLTHHRLEELRELLFETCSEMRSLGIPDTLAHRDLNPGNVLVADRCTFIDWAEATVGNPFLACEQFLAHVAQRGEEAQTWHSPLVSAYGRQWRDFLSQTQLDIAFTLAPILSIASCLYGRGTWLNSPDRHHPPFQAYRRSLARHIDRAARNLEQARIIWQPQLS